MEKQKSVVLLKPKAPAVMGFVYSSHEDLADLIGFVGKSPIVEIDGAGQPVYKYKKYAIVPGTVVFRNSYGDVVNTLTLGEAGERYDIVQQHEYNAKDHANKVQIREAKKK